MDRSNRGAAPAMLEGPAPADRAAADETAASEARARFRREGLPTIAADERVAPILAPGERVVALHHAALLDRREPAPRARTVAGVPGELYVTSSRLLLVGRVTLSFELEAIEEAVLSGERLLLVLGGGRGLTLQVAQPRLLWVEIAAARALAKTPLRGSSRELRDQRAAR